MFLCLYFVFRLKICHVLRRTIFIFWIKFNHQHRTVHNMKSKYVICVAQRFQDTEINTHTGKLFLFLCFFFFLFNFEQEHWTWYWFGCCCCCYYDIVGKVEKHALPVVQNKCFFLGSFVSLNFRYFAFFCLVFCCWWCCFWSLVNCYVEMMILFKYNSNMMTMTGGCFV